MLRGIATEIDIEAAKSNLKTLKAATGGLPVIAVVKADAYGHGAPALGAAFLSAGAESLAVAFISEARQLRDSGIKSPILVLFDTSEPEAFFDLSLTPVIHDLKAAGMLSKEAEKRSMVLDVHVKVDTGMGRMGLDDSALLCLIADLRNIRIAGIMSHLSDADATDKEFSLEQVRRFGAICDELRSQGLAPMRHLANSAATLGIQEARFDAVRPGIALYGINPFAEKDVPGLRPVMRATARIVALRKIRKGSPVSYARTYTTKRDTVAAVIAAGYADGYPRSLSNKSSVLINGKRAPVMGRVCMDLFVVDATDMPDARLMQEVVLMGSEGSETISAQELATAAGTIPYEILLMLGRKSLRKVARA